MVRIGGRLGPGTKERLSRGAPFREPIKDKGTSNFIKFYNYFCLSGALLFWEMILLSQEGGRFGGSCAVTGQNGACKADLW